MSYEMVGQRLVTDNGVTHRMIEALRSILKTILLVFGRDKRMLLTGLKQNPGRSERTHVNAPGVDLEKDRNDLESFIEQNKRTVI